MKRVEKEPVTLPEAPEKRSPLHPILFAGAGPGDPELITVKGQKALEAADYVLYTGSLVPKDLLVWTKRSCLAESSAGMHLDESIEKMTYHAERGEKVVRLHTGDPSLYGAINEQMVRLEKEGIPFKVIPGVTAAFAAAAALNLEYTVPEICQTLILTRISGRTKVPETESLESLAAHKASMAIYLSIGHCEKVAKILARHYGAKGRCAVVAKASQPDEKIIHTSLDQLAEKVREADINRTALIIVGKVLEIRDHAFDWASKLYDKCFSHGYRQSDTK